MLTKKLTDSCLCVTLSNNPLKDDEIQQLNVSIDQKAQHDIVLDFSMVEVLTSPCISNLLILNSLLKEKGHRLVFCNMAFLNKCIFTVCGLQDEFVFAKDQDEAIEILKSVQAGI